MSEPSWLTKGRSYIGFHEQPNNRGIDQFIALAHCGQVGDPWCAIFANACLEATDVRGTRSAAARSFEASPYFERCEPKVGCIVTMWRGGSPASGSGHVGFYVGEDSTGVQLLGGNQNDQVEIETHDRAHITGYWWPKSPSQTLTPGRFANITATVFGGAADPNTSAYDNHLITDTEM